jgi:hypothetical protein
MLGKFGKLLVLAGVVEGARRFAKANPEMAAQIAVRIIGLVDQLTKGRFHDQIEGVLRQLGQHEGN